MNPTPSRVLVVDDDDATRVGLSELLSNAGYEVRAVATFEEGQRILRTDTPDLLIADVRLGAYNGLQLLLSSHRPIPAIVITGFADPVLEADARRQGADYVLKPVSPSVVLDMVRRRLAEAGSTKFETMRRFARKTIPGGIPARIEDRVARIVEISYGGLRLEIPRGGASALPASISVRLPQADVAVRADVVWQTPLGDEGWLCGAAVSQSTVTGDREWRELVDAVA
jgi:DNA-binding response OmpR family regulator